MNQTFQEVKSIYSILIWNGNISKRMPYTVIELIAGHIYGKLENQPGWCSGFTGYDFTCNRGYKVDVKTAVLSKHNTWQFVLKNIHREADYYLLIPFKSKQYERPLHLWLVKSDEVIKGRSLDTMSRLNIRNDMRGLFTMSKFEQPNELLKLSKYCEGVKEAYRKHDREFILEDFNI